MKTRFDYQEFFKIRRGKNFFKEFSKKLTDTKDLASGYPRFSFSKNYKDVIYNFPKN